MSADYILRMIAQLTAMIAGIIAKRSRGDMEAAATEIETKCLEHIGLPFVVVKQSSPDALAALLESGGALRVTRSMILAELLLQDAAVCESLGNPASAAVSLAQAERLYTDSLPFLSGEEKEHAEKNLAAVATKRIDLG